MKAQKIHSTSMASRGKSVWVQAHVYVPVHCTLPLHCIFERKGKTETKTEKLKIKKVGRKSEEIFVLGIIPGTKY